ncbi:PAS domain S-box protein [Arenibacter sp. 6A1]|uniref:PAS domain-containing sensor histidine kinase n=1 Tax=Arenibacter sp. 6A1 TaxID=2720391 RepID=UPI001445BDD2|nr:PAS domain-containing sensor histidine kinase [Arenibacter sp. 6A1]NKI26460.1 PAS domain S-box protein [Arenibacter sp. 6A1]
MDTLASILTLKDAPVAIAMVDKEFNFITYSNIWFEELGIPKEDIRGKSFFDVVPYTPIIFKNILKNCLKQSVVTKIEQQHTKPNGSSQWYAWRVKPWKDREGNVSGLIINSENITTLKRTKELLETTQNVARIGGWELDLITNTIQWSDITKEIHEVPLSYVPSIDTAMQFYKEGEPRERIGKFIENAIEKGQSWDTEVQIVTASGKDLWVRAKGVPEFINGKIVRLFGVFQDIDTIKRAELENEIIVERLKIATAAANVGIWEYHLGDNTISWDDRMYALYGVKKESFTISFEAWHSCIHPDDKKRVLLEVGMALRGEKEFKTQFKILLPFDNIRHIRAIATMQEDEDGNIIKMVGTNWDITELVNTQLKLDKSLASLKGSFESSAVGMSLVGVDGSWLDVNESLCKSLGYTREEMMQLTFQDITHPDDLDEDLEYLQALLDGKSDSYQLEKRYFHKKGHIVYIILTVTAVKDISGNISHFISQILDITSRIEATKKSNELLKVSKSQNESLTNFAHIVSHNLRSPSSNLSMLINYLMEEEDKEERKLLENMILDASESLNETVQHLNEVISIKTDVQDQLQDLSLLEGIHSVVKNISGLLKESKVQCKIDINKDEKIKAVPAYLDSILLNLFTNSIKYCSPDRTPIINITAKKTADMVTLEFTDNGLGIDLDRHGDKIFGMYKTFHKHKDAKGIGLFITKNQIEAMNGKIQVRSKVDEGTTFIISLLSANNPH